jgi:CRISPR type III-A/MTUBE-associated protein Csm6
MTKYVLFSAIGGTDPISNFRDGSMLHICRVYKPESVYLYLSKEMCEFHDKDDRYRFCIHRLGELLGHKFDVHIIERRDLVDVHKFDLFYKEYRELIREIREKHSDATVILNVSSGTPSMKGALQFIAAVSGDSIIPVQVSTPAKKINEHRENIKDYDVHFYWEYNKDNTKDFENRCSKSESVTLLAEVMKNVVVNHIDAYDYSAALAVAESIKNHIPSDVVCLLKAMKWRTQLDVLKMLKELNSLPYDLLPEKNNENYKIVEYLLWLQTKIHNEEYADFVRGITPILTSLLERALKVLCNIDAVKDYCEMRGKNRNVPYWSLEKLNKNPEVLGALQARFKGNFIPDFLNTETMTVLLKHFSSHEIIEDIETLNKIEKKIRNEAAHTITIVTKERVINATEGYSPEDIFNLLVKVTKAIDIKIDNNTLKSYDNANRIIKNMLF